MVKDYVVFDLETTGLSPDKDTIIEIGALKVIQGKVADRFSEFINPHQKLTQQISELTGITDDMLAGARNLQVVVGDFVDFCEDYVVVGHNLGFDYRFTKMAAEKYHLPFEHEGIINSSAHRAYHDALATAKLYQTLAHYFETSEPKLFVPEKMGFKAKKQQPMTKKQKAYLKDLCKYHKIEFNDAMEQMTMSEASRWIDKTILQYGRMKRFNRSDRNE